MPKRPLPCDAWVAYAGTKQGRRVIVLDLEPPDSYTVLYGTSQPPWGGAQKHDEWTLLLHLEPRDYPWLSLTKDTFFYVETVEHDVAPNSFERPLGLFDPKTFADLKSEYEHYLRSAGHL